ncbi:uncharacterized protein LOC130546654 [Triplophysa rosa]|uniref:uncharacterized protein LOC130546654 n=1 Tax=Triplophysa rosa TaxID=992332 RepID=UPI002545F8A1|nr:uncharacterized protein LOC130546654 [Triplophysa rosa]
MERRQQDCNKNKQGETEKRKHDVISGKVRRFKQTEHKSKDYDGSAQEDRGDADGDEQEDREEDDVNEQEYREEDDGDKQEDREEDYGDEQEDRKEDDGNEEEYREEDDEDEQEDREEDEQEYREEDEQEYREEDDGDEQEDREEDEQEDRQEDDGNEQEDREEDDVNEQEYREEDDGDEQEDREEDDEDEQEDRQEDDGNEQEYREEDEQEDREEHDGEQQRVGEEKSQDGDEDSNLLKKQQDDDPVYPGAPLTKGQSLLLLMSYVLRHNLTGVALQDLLTLFNEHFPGLVPATSYLFHKAYGQFGQYVPHFCCINCENYMGPTGIAPKNCSSCNAEFDIENNLRVGSYFLVLSLSAQIVDILEKNDIHLNRKESNPGILSDIQCGAEYRKIKQNSVARPLLKNTKQFNGKYGCDFCLHYGGGPYVWETPEPPLRTDTDHFRHAMLATPEKPIMGVKGPSPLMELETFNMITGFVPDYQHCVCLGVTKQITSLWLDSKHHKEEWYLGSKVSDIDKALLAISPPVEVTRAPRSVKDRKFWKASEWRMQSK